MNTTIESLQALYVKNGGNLTDTYSDICGGAAVGNYTTIPDMVAACAKLNIGGGGGGAEKFVVTLTKENDAWTADKTVAEIVAAYEANKVVVAKYPTGGMYVELPLNTAVEYQGAYAAMFIGLANSGNDNKIVSVQCTNQGSGDVIATTEQSVPTSTNAPLIVTLTAGATEGQLVGDKTYKEVYDAFMAGRNCILNISAMLGGVAVLSVGHETGYTINASNEILATGSANDYVTITVGG